MQTLLIIDGNAIMHRAFHALPSFKSQDEIPTNIIYGFFSMLHKAVVDFKPTHLIVCFDTPKPTFRNKIFKNYQIQRPKINDDFIVQIPILKEAITKAGIVQIEKDGYEADDLIGTIAKKAGNNQLKVLILSGDKDILQLVDKKIFVISPQLGLATVKIYDEEEVKKKMLVEPMKIADLKALTGDPSDNYPGAKGIGPKTAAHLIQQFQTVENLLKNTDEIENEKVKKIVEEGKENIILSKKLATIITDVNVSFDKEKTEFSWFKEDLKNYLLNLDIKSLTKRIFSNKKSEIIIKKVKKTDQNQMGLF